MEKDEAPQMLVFCKLIAAAKEQTLRGRQNCPSLSLFLAEGELGFH